MQMGRIETNTMMSTNSRITNTAGTMIAITSVPPLGPVAVAAAFSVLLFAMIMGYRKSHKPPIKEGYQGSVNRARIGAGDPVVGFSGFMHITHVSQWPTRSMSCSANRVLVVELE